MLKPLPKLTPKAAVPARPSLPPLRKPQVEKEEIPSTKMKAAGKDLPGVKINALSIPGFHPATSMEDPGNPGLLCIGLDPSLTHFGYVEVTQSLEVLRHDTLVPKNLEGMERVHFLIQEIVYNRILPRRSMWTSGIRVFREDYAFAASSSSDTVLKELGGILEYVLYREKVPLTYLPIASIKKFTTGKGNSQKAEMLKAVYKTFGYDAKDEHEADAFSTALLGACTVSQNIGGLTSSQKEVLTAYAKAD